VKRLIMIAAGIAALAFAGAGSAALVPGVFDPGHTGCPVSTFSNGVLHLEKNCATSTNASAGADITGLNGQPFASAAFTLKGTSQCQGGSPRFNIFTTTGTFFLGCNNVSPVLNADGTATYTFNAATIAAGGNQVPVPTGTITSAEVLIDVQGTADLTHISVNGQEQVPAPTTTKKDCKHGGWKTFTNPSFKNQGQCIKFFNHQGHKAHEDGHKSGHDEDHHGNSHDDD
jgi:hypothetical protein